MQYLFGRMKNFELRMLSDEIFGIHSGFITFRIQLCTIDFFELCKYAIGLQNNTKYFNGLFLFVNF